MLSLCSQNVNFPSASEYFFCIRHCHQILFTQASVEQFEKVLKEKLPSLTRERPERLAQLKKIFERVVARAENRKPEWNNFLSEVSQDHEAIEMEEEMTNLGEVPFVGYKLDEEKEIQLQRLRDLGFIDDADDYELWVATHCVRLFLSLKESLVVTKYISSSLASLSTLG